MEYISGSNPASKFKSTQRLVRGADNFKLPATPELYDTKSNYQLIVATTNCEIRKSNQTSFYSKRQGYLQTVEKQLKEPISVQLIHARNVRVRLQLSNYKQLRMDSHVIARQLRGK